MEINIHSINLGLLDSAYNLIRADMYITNAMRLNNFNMNLLQLHSGSEINETIRIPRFVVVPSNNLNHVANNTR